MHISALRIAAGAKRQWVSAAPLGRFLGGPSTSLSAGSIAHLARFRPIAVGRSCLTISVLLLVSSIVQGNATSEGCPDSAVRIYLDSAGVITVNGQITSVADLRHTLSSLEPHPTEVCYSRADAQGEPPPEVKAVIQAIMALRVPVSFYTDNTFRTRVK